jgi:NADH:ubiquinone oxidoreductase subunit 5 (subunit L)/multisubunit Na+/H+ antiporter MnhA subunit
MAQKIVGLAVAVVAIAGLGLIAIKRMRMFGDDYFEKIRAGTNQDVSQLQKVVTRPPRWLAILLLFFGIIVTGLMITAVGNALDSGHIASRQMQYAESGNPVQYWLYVAQAACIATFAVILSIWSLAVLLRRRKD